MSRCIKLQLGTLLLCLGLIACTTNTVQDVITAASETAKKNLKPAAVYEGSPVTIYSQVAQGANSCWFSPKSKLRKNHMFHAVTATDRKYAMAAIHETAKDGKRGLKAFSVTFQETPKGTAIAFQNLRFRENIAQQMESDVKRWAEGSPDCSPPMKPPFESENPVLIPQQVSNPGQTASKPGTSPKP